MDNQETNMQEICIDIVGAGPGAADLITVRGLKALQEADFVLYAGSLVNPEHLKACNDTCVTKDSANLSLEEQVESMASYALDNKKVVRLHTGDPAMYGAINEQISLLAEKGIKARICPGVSSVFGAAAALGCELTAPEISQSVILTRTKGRTPMPPKENPTAFAKTKATLVFFLSTGNIAELTRELREEGELAETTPAAVVYRATWPEERIIRGTLKDIAEQVQDAGFGRQALIFVGEALRISNENSIKLATSKLYAKDFSHGYRNALVTEQFSGKCALYAFTLKGLARAKEISRGLNLPSEIYAFIKAENVEAEKQKAEESGELNIHFNTGSPLFESVKKQWQAYDAHIFVGATGIAVRTIAPLLENKLYDPAVIACPESGSHIISLTSGHIGGANRLARRIARITGGQAVISTATDVNMLPAFDEVVALEQARILNPQSIKDLNGAILAKKEISFVGKKSVYDKHFAKAQLTYCENSSDVKTEYAVFWDYPLTQNANCSAKYALHIDSRAFVLGMGCKKDTDYAVIKSSFEDFMQKNSLQASNIALIASCNLKAQEPAILKLAEELNLPTAFYPEDELNKIEVPNPSVRVHSKVETASVCEASALFSIKDQRKANSLYAPKAKYASTCTFALARLGHGEISDNTQKTSHETKKATMLVVGLGSGSMHQITPEVISALTECDVIAGYKPYVDFIRHLVEDKEIIQNGMMGEVARCTNALEVAATGKSVCMVCSGDPGILAMAGLLMELQQSNGDFAHVEIRVCPGITSANIAAASLGAPLQNGFCLVSLSDLLVPREEVIQNLKSVAQSALPVALYNPAGKKRREVLAEALQIFEDARGGEIYSAYVRNAGRPTEEKWIGLLKDMPQNEIDMSTLLIIGSKRTVYENNYLYEKRGYIEKYLSGE